ncbi:hypothetical protein NIES3806_30070 [Microcystis aeruginosa NIES-3806]|nr:hypothetical protein NIES3806_30070 [Microcystis aeruginosa NIES-3806]
MPPVCPIGLGLSQGNWVLSWGATLLYITNLLGIALSCLLVFLLAGYSNFHRARNAIVLTSILTAVLLIPLGISFATLSNQARLERLLKKALLQRTITFQRAELLESSINWLKQPPWVRLVVRTSESITPRQVELLEEFITKEMGRPFQLNVLVSKVNEVTAPE